MVWLHVENISLLTSRRPRPRVFHQGQDQKTHKNNKRPILQLLLEHKASSHKMNQQTHTNIQQMGQQTMIQTTYPSAGLIGAAARQHHHHQPNPTTNNDDDAPTLRDVLNGRGQGVQRHPGNVKYRTLVFVNKVSGRLLRVYFLCRVSDLFCAPARVGVSIFILYHNQ